MFDLEKLEQSVFWLLRKHGGRLNYTKLIKLIYLADKEALKSRRASITGDDYFALDNGPVATRLYDLIKGRAEKPAQLEWDSLFRRDGYDLVSLRELPRDWIADSEVDALNAVDERFGGMDWRQLVAWTHDPANCPEWQAPPRGRRVPISKADILRALGRSEAQIRIIMEEDAIHDAFARSAAALPP